MVNKKAVGKRAKTRYKLRTKGKKLTVNALLQQFAVGQRVQVNIKGSIHSGLPHHRFHGLTGIVSKKQGDSFVVELNDGNKSKELIVTSAHLKPVA